MSCFFKYIDCRIRSAGVRIKTGEKRNSSAVRVWFLEGS